MKLYMCVLAMMALASQANAADLEAGKAKAEEVCFACHGSDGVSVSPDIPNLAAQKEGYLAGQLKAFRAESRKNPVMNAMAGQLSDADIENLAAYFSGLPGAAPGAMSAMSDALNKTEVRFPTGYEQSFKYYTTIDFPDRKQVRRYLANDAAMRAAAAGQPMPNGAVFLVEIHSAKLDGDGKPVMGGDGFIEGDKITGYTAMEMQAGWGDDFPEALRNGDWNYAVFAADGTRRDTVNQAACLACHKPLADQSYLFTIDALQKQARAN